MRFSTLLALAVLLAALSGQALAVDWSLRKIDGRDYVPITQVAEFYGLNGGFARVNKSAAIQSGTNNMVFTKGTRESTINGVKHWLSFPVEEWDGKLHISRVDLAKTVEPAMRPHLVKGFKPVTTVVIDAGHGGSNKGAYSPIGYEKEFTLDVARRVQILLQKAGFRVLMTRNRDQDISLKSRAGMANEIPNSILVSLHFNSATWNRSAEGFEIYSMTPQGSPSTNDTSLKASHGQKHSGNSRDTESFALSNAIYHAMLGKMDMEDRGVKRARFAVLRHAKVPSVLVEGGFMTNKGDLKKMASTEWRAKYAQAIALGIIQYKQLAESRVQPKQLADYKGPVAPRLPSVTLREVPSAER